jgi:hypothetical protein
MERDTQHHKEHYHTDITYIAAFAKTKTLVRNREINYRNFIDYLNKNFICFNSEPTAKKMKIVSPAWESRTSGNNLLWRARGRWC